MYAILEQIADARSVVVEDGDGVVAWQWRRTNGGGVWLEREKAGST